jgi:hypothetical protein
MCKVVGAAALHRACGHRNDENETFAITYLLVQAGADPILTNDRGLAPLAYLRQQHPTYHTTIALLEHALANAETTSLLVKARRLVATGRIEATTPSYLQGRVARGWPLPRVVLAALTGGQDEEEGRKLRTTLTFLLGIGGGSDGEGMPRDVFRVVLDMLMQRWDPLRRGLAGEEGAAQPTAPAAPAVAFQCQY